MTEEKEPNLTTCPHCGYDWICRAKTRYVSCPSCLGKFVPIWHKDYKIK